jgi:RNA polymerase sigma factor (sigma-70 family)
MGEPTPVNLTGPQLFLQCAASPSDDECWSEFIRRYQPLLIRSITHAWRRRSQEEWPSPETFADLLQEVYAAILKDDRRLLRRFRGQSEAEAESYLAHAAINQVFSQRRAGRAKKRKAELVSLDELIAADEGGEQFADRNDDPSEALTEREWVKLLRQIFTGPTSQRDILIFLLHARDGWTAAEIARMEICNLKKSSVANLLVKMKAQVKKYYLGE